ncbi:MAG TPA: YibE/F family protein [Clostridiales bacterium]|nr:YibE/F family protein [Clostridiales bacterium]
MILALGIILFALMSLIGSERGVKSFVALFLNILITMISIYLLIQGVNTIFVMLASTVLFSLVTLFYINEYNLKTVGALFSVILVVVLLSLLITFISYHGHIAGYNEIDIYEEISMYLSVDLHINTYQLLILTTIWGLLGAILDTSISVASAIHEIAVIRPDASRKDLFRSGMAIGKDILGTTANTLVFVALGESLMLALYYYKAQYAIETLINAKSFLQEIAAVFTACIGCTLIIPITAAMISYFLKSPRIGAYFYRKNTLPNTEQTLRKES